MKKITLAWYEAAMASDVGRMRHLASIKAGLQDAHGFTGDGWSEHIEGACGEMAVAKSLGIYWDGSVNSFSADDLPGLQIRTRSRDHYDLLVRRSDRDDAVFVLVTGRCPNYVVHGWARAGDVKLPEYEREYGGREAAWFVPQSALQPIELITEAASGVHHQ
jgi:hypothetical protein